MFISVILSESEGACDRRRVEVEPFCGRERSGSPQAKSRSEARELQRTPGIFRLPMPHQGVLTKPCHGRTAIHHWAAANSHRLLVLLLLLACPVFAQSPAFSARDASTLLRRLGDALESHSRKDLLALFDFNQMKGGPLLKEQLNSFLSNSESIRVHLNLVETTEDQRMTVDAEMEVQPANGGQAWRRSQRLNFTIAARAGQGWKFIDVQPRSFFSLP
jgi:hypothetical protein